MKQLFYYLIIGMFSAFTAHAQTLKEVNSKPSTKEIISLNSTKSSEWTLYYGVQDKNAPQTPDALLHSEFKNIPATVPGNVEIDLEREGIRGTLAQGEREVQDQPQAGTLMA